MSSFNEAMLLLADAGAIFIGQGVASDGIAMSNDLQGIPESQRIELPVIEEMQLGMATGMAMQGMLVVAQYPRLDFLMRAMDQLVNHLDKIEQMSQGQWKTKVIIRTRVGSKKPLDAGPQHSQNHVPALRLMLTNIDVYEITKPKHILPTYQKAFNNERSSLVVENLG